MVLLWYRISKGGMSGEEEKAGVNERKGEQAEVSSRLFQSCFHPVSPGPGHVSSDLAMLPLPGVEVQEGSKRRRMKLQRTFPEKNTR